VPQTAWLVQRSAIVIALVVGFYALALTVVALLFILGVLLINTGLRGFIFALGAFGAASTILMALIPRRDIFNPPGPRIDAGDEPRLFEFIGDIASRLRQRIPDDVYLSAEANVGVTEQGGGAGRRSRRVMVIGLPMMQVLSVDEFRAMIAHEFGHYASHDLKLGPWIHRTRKALARAESGLQESFISVPFEWYSSVFLRLTFLISRRQEIVADEISVRVAGRDAAASALRRVNAVGPAYQLYFLRDVAPGPAGRLPPARRRRLPAFSPDIAQS
jgi:Zn-dependent protease with chaperone function